MSGGSYLVHIVLITILGGVAFNSGFVKILKIKY